MVKSFSKYCVIVLAIFLSAISVAYSQPTTVYDQLVSVNKEWLKQTDADPALKSRPALQLSEQQFIQLHLSETEKLLRSRSAKQLTATQKNNRENHLNTLHGYLLQGNFPKNTYHPANRQPYFIDIFNNYCAVGYLMKQSGADKMAREINKTQNYSYLRDIKHPDLINWATNSGLSVDELALIQPGYIYPPQRVTTIMEMHYANAGPDVNEYIELRQSVNPYPAGIYLGRVDFYDHLNILYKTVMLNDMQSFNMGGGNYYYYLFPPGENFADSGRIEIMYTFNNVGYSTLTTYNYNSSGVSIIDQIWGHMRSYSVAENESTLPNSSLNFCGTYGATSFIGWDLLAMANSIASLNTCVVLPLEIHSFNYIVKNNSVHLQWQTASEYNTDKFEIEKSTDGANFNKVGTVASAGISNTAKDYYFPDANPAAINYYRIKQIDKDGKSSYSKTIPVKFKGGNPLSIQPNIVTNQLRVNIGLQQQEKGHIQVYDISGKAVLNFTGRSGYNEINVSGFSAGSYFIRLQTRTGESFTGRFIKQ